MKNKKYYLLLFLFISINILAQTHYQEIIRYENKRIKSILTFSNNDILDGETIHYYPNGLIKSYINYSGGKVNGLIENYYSNGNLESSGLVVNDLAENLFNYYHENGKLKQ